MNKPALSVQTQKFLDQNVSNLEELQILFLLRSAPGQEWNASNVAEEIRIDPISACRHLMDLHNKDLLGHKNNRGPSYSYWYNVKSNEKENHIMELAAAFQNSKFEIIDYLNKRNRVGNTP